MANNAKAKLKTLHVMRMLQDETDADHGLTMTQILQNLADLGIPAERKGIYRDIETLREFGLNIQTYQRNPVEYAIPQRDFELSELMLLVDAVESCKFLTRRQANRLVSNLKTFANDRQRELLERRIHVAGRIRSQNDGVFGSIDTLHEAIRTRKAVHFKYYRYGVDGRPCATRDGQVHEVTPVGISFADGYYYLSAWDDEYGDMTEYRIDRMGGLGVSDTPAVKNEQITHHSFDGDDYVLFGRFAGEPVTATLLVDGDKVEIIMDRFGDAAQIRRHDDETAKAVVKVHKSEQFFGWVAGLGGTVRIAGPRGLKDEYREYLLGLVEK